MKRNKSDMKRKLAVRTKPSINKLAVTIAGVRIYVRVSADWSAPSLRKSPTKRVHLKEIAAQAGAVSATLSKAHAVTANTASNQLQTSTSISHTRTLGGFAFATTKRQVGFDLEPVTRKISEAAYSRAATSEERNMLSEFTWPARSQLQVLMAKQQRQILQPIALWVIKEAAWKALRGPQQPKTISQIKILSLTILAQKTRIHFTFNSKEIESLKPLGEGCIFIHQRTIVGIALLTT